MKCQRCGRGAATVHVTDILHNVRRERHLCDGCAAEAHLFGPAPSAEPGGSAESGDPVPELNLQALVQLIFGATSAPGATGLGGSGRPAEPAQLVCAHCGLGYAEFRKTGRLGCPADYDAFADALLNLLERVHRGGAHAGKTPRRGRLVAELAAAIESEDYETAAQLRDAIRRQESDR